MRFIYFTIFLFFAVHGNAQIIINEISYNSPEAGDDSLEYIEIYNAGPDHVDITGWYFTSGIVDTLPVVHLSGGQYYVTAVNASAMQNIYNINVHQWTGGALSNSGETITLVDNNGNFVDSVRYDDTSPWPTEPDGNGPSLELISPSSDNNDGANWQFSGGLTGVIINGNEVAGTPGAQNSGGGTSGPAATVNITGIEFDPRHVVVAVGDSVRWVNGAPVPHNVNGQQSVYPNNAESFFSGVPAPGPWEYYHEFNVPGLNDYHCDVHVNMGMRGTVSVYDPNGFTEFPLMHLRLNDGTNGQAIFNGVPTVVEGVVHGINFMPGGLSFYIIDENNTGINVFSFDPSAYVVTEGDMLRIEGVIEQFNGLLEIIPSNITVLSTGNSLTSPQFFTELDESTEGSHLVLSPYTIDSIVATGTTGWNVYVKDEDGNNVLIRVDADTGLTEDDFSSSNGVRGIGTQFDASFPFTSGYQILALEFFIVDGVKEIARDAVSMYPNPASNSVLLQSEYQIESIELYSLDGRVVLQQKSNGNSASINVTGIQEGLYLIKGYTPVGNWTSLLSIIK